MRPEAAIAQPRIAVLEPSGDDRQLSGPLERTIRTRLGELGIGGDIESSPLAWRDLALAAGCMQEDAACYAEVASQLGVDELLLASATSNDETCVVELGRWHDGTIARRTLREHGGAGRFAILDAVAPALRELYDLPPAPVIVAEPAPVVRHHDPDVAGPIVLGVVSLGLLGGGLALAFVADASRSAWQLGPTATVRDVDLTLDARDRAERELIAADVLFGAAAAGLTAAVVWLIVELTHGDDVEVDARSGRLSMRWAL
jgi:hypothetical protein